MASDSPADRDVSDRDDVPQEEPEPVAHHVVSEPIDLSYRIVVRTALWVIAGAVFVGFALWWVLT